MKRTRLLALTSAGVIAIGAGGFALGRQVKSPADAAAEVAAPSASRLAVPVERRILSSTIITRGDVRFGDPKPVVLPPSTLKATGGNLVTQPAVKGQEIVAGKRILEVAGRPVIALVGATPAYRDMRPGDTGNDIAQLEKGLTELGLNPGTVDGRYDAATERAVELLYRQLGYDAFGPTDAQRTQLQQLRDSSSRAADGVRTAQRTYDTASRPTKSRQLQANEQVRSAKDKAGSAPKEKESAATKASNLVTARRAALEQARATRDQAAATLRKAERDRDDPAAVVDAQRAVDDASAALADADAAIVQAARAVPEAQRAIDDARATMIDSQKSLDVARDAEKRGSVVQCATPSPCEVPDASPLREATRSAESRLRQANSGVESAVAALAMRQDGVVSAQRSRDRAARAVDRAQEAARKANDAGPDRQQVVVDATARLAQADAALAQADRDVTDALDGVVTADRQGTSGEQSAAAAVEIAQAGERELTNSSELKSLQSALGSARETQRRADTDLAEVAAKVGISVPANEIIFLPDLPRRVDDVKVGRGEPTTGAVITVTNARLAVDTSVDAVDATRLRVASKGQIEAEDLSLTLPVTITKIANRPGTDGVPADKVKVELTIDAGAAASESSASPAFDPATLNGVNVKVTLPIQSTGKAVLAVPIAAVSIAGDGTSRVEVEDTASKPTRFVTVIPGLAAEGYVEITPIAGQRLVEGDLVVVGTQGATDLTVTTDAAASPDSASPDSSTADSSTADSSAPDLSTAAGAAESTA